VEPNATVQDQTLGAKERERQRLARLPMPEKIRLVVMMQKRADAIRRARGLGGREIWNTR
jgi:hypothetical protein